MQIFLKKPSGTRLIRAGLLGASMAFGLATAPAASATPDSPFAAINAAAKAGPIKVERLRGKISVLEGSGGNITALSTPRGFFLVDTGIAVSKDMIVRALNRLGPGPVRLAVDTHWHWDHADGNSWVRASGASVIASRRTVERLKQIVRVVEWKHTFTPILPQLLPNLVLSGDRDIGQGDASVRIRHYRAGHTDGDVSVYFKKQDVLSVGDTFWNGQYPFIDYVTGGSIDGAIAAANANISMATAHTIIVPGHGPVGDLATQTAFRNMLVAIRARVAKLKAEGKTLAQAQAAKPTADFDKTWGRSVISGELFTALVYRGV